MKVTTRYSLLFLYMMTGIFSACSFSYNEIQTKYVIMDLSGIKGKKFIQNKNTSLKPEYFDDLVSLKSTDDSIFIYSYTVPTDGFVTVSNDLLFPDLLGVNPLLKLSSGYVMPIQSTVNSEKDLRVDLLVAEYWGDNNFSGIWIVMVNNEEVSNFIILKNSGELDLEGKWDQAMVLLDRFSVLKSK